MRAQKLEIGHPLTIAVRWYDKVPEPQKIEDFEGEIVGWRTTQVIVRVKNYAVLRFWKRTGLEVGNGDHQRRGFRVDLPELSQSIRAAREGVEIPMEVPADGPVPVL